MERPLEKSVFSGVIQERSNASVGMQKAMDIPERKSTATTAKKPSRFLVSQQQQNHYNSA